MLHWQALRDAIDEEILQPGNKKLELSGALPAGSHYIIKYDIKAVGRWVSSFSLGCHPLSATQCVTMEYLFFIVIQHSSKRTHFSDCPELQEALNVLCFRIFDVAYIMAYDYHGPWDSETGHNSPLFPRKADTNQLFNTVMHGRYFFRVTLRVLRR